MKIRKLHTKKVYKGHEPTQEGT